MTVTDAGRDEVLDWVRALAISLVVAFHALGGVVPGGGVGVSVFFVLSGYLIASILMRDGMLTPANLGRFLLRRLARIYPLYLLDVIVATVYVTQNRSVDAQLVRSSLLGLLTFTGQPGIWLGFGFGVLWTLFAEFWFYLTFPFLLWVALASRRVLWVFAAAAGISLLAKVLHKQTLTLLYYDHFLLGATAFYVLRQKITPAIFGRKGAPLFGLAMILLAAAIPYPGSRNGQWHAASLCAAAGAGIVIVALHVRPPRFTLPGATFIARISYSVYFVHGTLLDFFPGLADSAIAYLTVVGLVSMVTYHLVERPFIRLAAKHLKFTLAHGSSEPLQDAHPLGR